MNLKSKLRSSDILENTPKLMQSVVQEAKVQFSKHLHSEEHPASRIHRGQPEFSHNMMFRTARSFDLMKIVALSRLAFEEVLASRILKKKENIPIEDFEYDQLNYGFQGTSLGQSCDQIASCHHHQKYRTDDGSCNNPHPSKSFWGAADYPMQKLLPPAYEDGIWSPRRLSLDGSNLASPREISRILFDDIDRPDPRMNCLVMQFGQFVAHDLTQSASMTLGNGKPISCCTEDGSSILPPDSLHFACLPIFISPDDPFYGQFNQGCINFVRSSLVPQDDCKIGYAKQLSKVTHFLDGSQIYGSDSKTLAELREFRHGRLRMFHDFGHELLPQSKEKDDCLATEKGSACFMSGDGRTNQIISLTALHVIFAREHNRIAAALHSLNPHWHDELLFLEAKRIVIAEYQVIVFKEWLPLIIGEEAMDRFDLRLHHNNYCHDYDSNVNPSMTNEFAAAAFRFGHSTVDGKFVINHNNHLDEVIPIPDVMFNPARLRHHHFYDEILNTMVRQPMQQLDASLTKGLTQYLFRSGNPFGLDLASLNIQRGRDHGLRPYNDYREVSGRPRIRDFVEFGHDAGAKLSSVYKFPDDVDLWVGGLHETAHHGAIVGLTFVDIIADQFSRLKRGDRYFFENSPKINPGHFTLPQLAEIRKASIARLLCDNSDRRAFHSVGKDGFLLTGST